MIMRGHTAFIAGVALLTLQAGPSVGAQRTSSLTFSYLTPAVDGKISAISLVRNSYIMKILDGSTQTSDSHDGGVLRVTNAGDHHYISLGISVPKKGVYSWNSKGNQCRSIEISADVTSITCESQSRTDNLNFVYSNIRGVVAFTGYCWTAQNRLCDYVLVNSKGIAPGLRN